MVGAVSRTETISVDVTDGQQVINQSFPDVFTDETGAVYVAYAELETDITIEGNSTQVTLNLDYKTDSDRVISQNEVDTKRGDGTSKTFESVIQLNEYVQEGTVLSASFSGSDSVTFKGDQTVNIDVTIIGRRAV